jgi:hypothetical protein
MRDHCARARYMWNLYQFGTLETYGKASRGVDRDGNEYIYQKRRTVRPVPGYVEQARMLTQAHAEYAWLAAGAQNVQQCCVACGFTCNADINASINIAAGHAGGTPPGVREPQLLASLTGKDAVGISRLGRGRMSSPSFLDHATRDLDAHYPGRSCRTRIIAPHAG